jgi:imidazolonepropionase
LLTDIAELLTLRGEGQPGQPGEASLGLCHDGEVVIEDGVVVYAGPRDKGPRHHELSGEVRIESAGGRLVTPGLCDPHTHPIWAGDRSTEFDLRNQGKSYAEIQKKGGGILSTVLATSAKSDETLVQATRARLLRMLAQGVVRCEAKTGYGLSPESELRLLRLLREAAAGQPVAVSPTFLCHVPPPGLAGVRRQGAVAGLGGCLAQAAAEGAQAVDVYCDEGAFTIGETEQLLRAGQKAGLMLRCHAEQFTRTGAAALAASLGAVSVEHLEEIDEEGIAALLRAGTVANLLPGAALTMRLRWPPARRLIDAGVRVALGTDHNPGTSLTESLPLMMTLGCTQMGMTCAEAWRAVTVNAAAALGRGGGTLVAGGAADLVMWDAENHREVCQHFGGALCHRVYIGGRRRYQAEARVFAGE